MEKETYLTIIETLPKGRCIAKCVCGNVKNYNLYSVRHGRARSCGCMKQALINKQVTNKKVSRKKVAKPVKFEFMGLTECRDAQLRTDIHQEIMADRTKVITPDDPEFAKLAAQYTPPKNTKIDRMATYKGLGG